MTDEYDAALDRLGEALMQQVRDVAISSWDHIVSGHMKGRHAEQVRTLLHDEGVTRAACAKELVPQIVDTTLHYLLWMLEQREDCRLVVSEGGVDFDIAEVSDGLAGELYTEDGWIIRFSRKRYTPPS